MYSLEDLDQSKACEVPYRFEVTDEATGKGTGIFLSVIGGQAQKIQDYAMKVANERRVEEAMAAKRDPRGKKPQIVKAEADVEVSTELVALRIVGWEGIKEPYSHDLAVKLCSSNLQIKQQAYEASEDLKNFRTPFTKNSASTSAIQPG